MGRLLPVFATNLAYILDACDQLVGCEEVIK